MPIGLNRSCTSRAALCLCRSARGGMTWRMSPCRTSGMQGRLKSKRCQYHEAARRLSSQHWGFADESSIRVASSTGGSSRRSGRYRKYVERTGCGRLGVGAGGTLSAAQHVVLDSLFSTAALAVDEFRPSLLSLTATRYCRAAWSRQTDSPIDSHRHLVGSLRCRSLPAKPG